MESCESYQCKPYPKGQASLDGLLSCANIYWGPMEIDIERNEIDNIQQQSSKDETEAHNSAYLLGNLHTNTDEIKIWSDEEKNVNGNEGEEVVETEERNLEWSLELKVSLVELETEARVLGKGHMMEVKEMWDEKYPEYRNITAQHLRDNGGRFRQERSSAAEFNFS